MSEATELPLCKLDIPFWNWESPGKRLTTLRPPCCEEAEPQGGAPSGSQPQSPEAPSPEARHVMMLLPGQRVTSSLWDVSAEAPDITEQRQIPKFALPTVLIHKIICEIKSWLQPAKFGDNSLCNKNKNSLYSTHHNSYAKPPPPSLRKMCPQSFKPTISI